MRSMPLSKVYQLLEPGPVVLVTTASSGRVNAMTMSWHMMGRVRAAARSLRRQQRQLTASRRWLKPGSA